jgi:hypothetical protein
MARVFGFPLGLRSCKNAYDSVVRERDNVRPAALPVSSLL